MDVEKILKDRSGEKCELCGATDGLARSGSIYLSRAAVLNSSHEYFTLRFVSSS